MFRWLSQKILALSGWKIVGRFPYELRKFVLIVMPHTSGWDFPLGVLSRGAIGVKMKYLAKDSLFRPPFGWFFRAMGGYPVDRTRRQGYVDTAVDLFRRHEDFILTIAPEGTRRKVDRIKSGFYFIAKGAGVPIVMVRFDYRRREVAIREPFWPTDERAADFRVIIDYFRDAQGKHPELGIDEHVGY